MVKQVRSSPCEGCTVLLMEVLRVLQQHVLRSIIQQLDYTSTFDVLSLEAAAERAKAGCTTAWRT